MASNIGPKVGGYFKVPSGLVLEFKKYLATSQLLLQNRSGEILLVDCASQNLENTFMNLGDKDREHFVFLAQILREDQESLVAFASAHERQLFCEIKNINSIGVKFAVAALRELGPSGLSDLMRGAKPQKVPGLGPKTLEKIAQGMKSKEKIFLALLENANPYDVSLKSPSLRVSASGSVPTWLSNALVQMGIRESEVELIYASSQRNDPELFEKSPPEIIKSLLKAWGQSKRRAPIGEQQL